MKKEIQVIYVKVLKIEGGKCGGGACVCGEQDGEQWSDRAGTRYKVWMEEYNYRELGSLGGRLRSSIPK